MLLVRLHSVISASTIIVCFAWLSLAQSNCKIGLFVNSSQMQFRYFNFFPTLSQSLNQRRQNGHICSRYADAELMITAGKITYYCAENEQLQLAAGTTVFYQDLFFFSSSSFLFPVTGTVRTFLQVSILIVLYARKISVTVHNWHFWSKSANLTSFTFRCTAFWPKEEKKKVSVLESFKLSQPL